MSNESTKGRDAFWGFMKLEKAYDTIERHGMELEKNC